ncbi:conjugal transfer protein [Streptomyces sp. NPDC051546]|uniref:conjugal transfer protein n=1 Tax=Streptomyces sp. NPDC051546 TaxID=3365655 RepID=UPI0037B5516E
MPAQGDRSRPSNPWEEAGADLRNAAPNPRVQAPATASGPRTPWVAHEEARGALFAKRLGRGLAWTVLILAAITGVRAWVIPPKAATPPPAPTTTGPTYPTAEAQALAGRFGRAYLSWDEAKAAERAALLTPVLADGAETTMGWDGHGRQDVLAVEPGQVTPGKQGQARVRVDVLIRTVLPSPDGKTPAPESPARWVGLDVPVVQAAGRVIVSGRPGLVGVPAAGPKMPALTTPKADAALTAATQSVVTKFLTAYAGGDTETVTAPGVSVPPLPEGVKFKSLDSWTADAGSGSDRTGTALVSWTVGGASISQTYRLELTSVSSAEAQRWQVAAVRGGTD